MTTSEKVLKDIGSEFTSLFLKPSCIDAASSSRVK